EFFEFPVNSIEDLPLFQAQRLISYSAWISRRWADPSFPALFPQFGSFNYWAEEVEALEKCWQSIQRRP
ncbi:MAG: hypothetical protein WCH11_06135, partial [Bdellovibrio sp.]